ncbi:MAG: transporter, permease protein [Frankiales bacterium]|nr:transporter, permease protein [Frankiales bacterium]
MATSTPFRWWLLSISLSRAPVTMAPLTLGLAGRSAYGSFATGALLGGVCAFGQALGTLWRGPALDRPDRPRALGIELLLCGSLFLLLTLELAFGAHLAATLLTASFAGCFGAAVPGGFLARLPAILQEGQLSRGFTINAVVLELNWVVAPLFVMVVALWLSPVVSVACISASLLASALTQEAFPSRTWAGSEVGGSSRSPWRLQDAREIYALALATAFGLTLVEASLPALLAARGIHAELAGIFTGVPAAASVLAGLLMLRLPDRHLASRRLLGATLLCLVLGLVLLPLTWASSLPWIVGTMFCAGLTFAPMNALSSQTLQEVLPADRRAEGFALLYAALRLGVGAGGGSAAALLTVAPPASVIALAGLGPALLSALLLGRAATRSWARRRDVQPARPATGPLDRLVSPSD